jgi:hypothetical protein
VKKLTFELPDSLYQETLELADRIGTTPERLIVAFADGQAEQFTPSADFQNWNHLLGFIATTYADNGPRLERLRKKYAEMEAACNATEELRKVRLAISPVELGAGNGARCRHPALRAPSRGSG